jgi:hypothetical protein
MGEDGSRKAAKPQRGEAATKGKSVSERASRSEPSAKGEAFTHHPENPENPVTPVSEKCDAHWQTGFTGFSGLNRIEFPWLGR